jgi:hypothetical protein
MTISRRLKTQDFARFFKSVRSEEGELDEALAEAAMVGLASIIFQDLGPDHGHRAARRGPTTGGG